MFICQMVAVLNLQEFSRRKSLNERLSQLRSIYEGVGIIEEEYLNLIQYNPQEAIQNLPKFIGRVRKEASPGGIAYEGWAGGPNQDWIMPLINATGVFYEFLDREARKGLIIKIIDYFDGLRCDYSQNHMELVEEPLLARDILVNRQIYFPGWEPYKKLLEKCKSWEDFQKGLEKDEGRLIRSPFYLTFAVIRPEVCSLAIRKEYYKKFPDLVDRTLDAKAGLTAVWSRQYGEQEKYSEKQIQKEIINSVNRADPLLHKKLWKKIEAQEWILID